MALMLSEKFFDAAGGKHQKAGSGPKKMGGVGSYKGVGYFFGSDRKKIKMVLPSKIFFGHEQEKTSKKDGGWRVPFFGLACKAKKGVGSSGTNQSIKNQNTPIPRRV